MGRVSASTRGRDHHRQLYILVSDTTPNLLNILIGLSSNLAELRKVTKIIIVMVLLQHMSRWPCLL